MMSYRVGFHSIWKKECNETNNMHIMTIWSTWICLISLTIMTIITFLLHVWVLFADTNFHFYTAKFKRFWRWIILRKKDVKSCQDHFKSQFLRVAHQLSHINHLVSSQKGRLLNKFKNRNETMII